MFCAIIKIVGYYSSQLYGVEVFSTLDLYNLAWQAGLICTLAGSNTIDANNSITAAVERMQALRASFTQPAYALV